MNWKIKIDRKSSFPTCRCDQYNSSCNLLTQDVCLARGEIELIHPATKVGFCVLEFDISHQADFVVPGVCNHLLQVGDSCAMARFQTGFLKSDQLPFTFLVLRVAADEQRVVI
jgi:hypothetical protein